MIYVNVNRAKITQKEKGGRDRERDKWVEITQLPTLYSQPASENGHGTFCFGHS